MPDEMVTLGPPVATWDSYTYTFMFAVTFPLVGTFIGIAEAARGS